MIDGRGKHVTATLGDVLVAVVFTITQRRDIVKVSY